MKKPCCSDGLRRRHTYQLRPHSVPDPCDIQFSIIGLLGRTPDEGDGNFRKGLGGYWRIEGVRFELDKVSERSRFEFVIFGSFLCFSLQLHQELSSSMSKM